MVLNLLLLPYNYIYTDNQKEIASSGNSILKDFQVSKLTIAEKSKSDIGLAMAKYIDGTVQSGYSGYYFARNTRFLNNRLAANGRIPMQQFMDLLGFNGKFNYANLNWESLKIVNRIISGWVGRSMQKREKIVIQATDSLSTKQREEEFEELEYYMYNRAMLEELQQASGVQVIPQGKEIPADKDELDLFKSLFKTPEEILYELGINNTFNANGCYDVLKEKWLHDSAEVGLVCSYTWMDEDGVVHVDYVKPENAIYSWSDYPDFRDTTWRGQVRSMKVSELRRKYGVEFGGKLTEEQIYEIAATSKDWQLNDKLRWNAEWSVAIQRPYDEWNVDALEFEVKTVDSEKYTVTETKQNKSTIIQKGTPKKIRDNQKVIDDTNWNIYRGVYLRQKQMILEWGIKKNMIRSQDPKEIGNAEFSYSFYMYQNYQMRNLAIPEKISVPLRQLIVIDMKMQQVVAKMRPTGSAINWDAIQNIDYGTGDNNKNVDFKTLFDQTGDMYYRGYDAEGKPMGVPITELQNTGFVGQMQALMEMYRFQYQLIKDELGENPDLMNQAIQPRVTGENVVASQQAADNSTNYMYNAVKEMLRETAKKVSCLLQKSVLFGAKTYRKLLKEEDVDNRIFGTNIEMLPTEQDIAILNEKMNQSIVSNPDIVMYLDTYKVLTIARENVKLAHKYYESCMKKMLISKMQQAQQNAEMNAQAQQQSVVAKGQMDMQIKQFEAQAKTEEIRLQGESQNKSAVINMVSALLSKGLPISADVKPLVDTVMQNLMLPFAVENQQQQQSIIQQMQAAQQEQMEGEEEGGMELEQLQQHETQESPQMEQQEEQQIQPPM